MNNENSLRNKQALVLSKGVCFLSNDEVVEVKSLGKQNPNMGSHSEPVQQIIEYIRCNLDQVHTDMIFNRTMDTHLYLSNFGNSQYKYISLQEIDTRNSFFDKSPKITIGKDFKTLDLKCSSEQYNELVDLIQPLIERDFLQYCKLTKIIKEINLEKKEDNSLFEEFLQKKTKLFIVPS